jgi:hypothetical protein
MQIALKARAVLLVLAAAAWATPARADMPALPPANATMPDDAACETAGHAAEIAWNLPPGLLASVGHIEAGRYDRLSGRVVAWPWTINALGRGHYFGTKAEAIAGVQDLQMGGVQSIDVGCFQMNLMFHAGAFASLDEAFDADANARAAARFLSELHDRSGSWETAVAWYHSATPGLGEPYRDRVLADWHGGGLRILPVAALRPAGPVWGVSGRAVTGARDPFVLTIAARASGVAVWTPSWASATTPAAVSASLRRASPMSGRLPRVITPQG